MTVTPANVHIMRAALNTPQKKEITPFDEIILDIERKEFFRASILEQMG